MIPKNASLSLRDALLQKNEASERFRTRTFDINESEKIIGIFYHLYVTSLGVLKNEKTQRRSIYIKIAIAARCQKNQIQILQQIIKTEQRIKKQA